MAVSFTLGTAVFPPGTSVAVYPESNWLAHQLPPSGDPVGSEAFSGTMGDSSLSVTGLTEGTRYYAYGEVNSVGRYVGFTAGADVEPDNDGATRSGDETWSGDKTFTGAVDMSGASSVAYKDNTIVNADVKSDAAIDGSKLSGVRRLLAQSAVAVPHTGDTSETTLATITLPAGVMGANGRVEITTMWSRNSGGVGNVTPRTKFGGTTFQLQTMGTTGLSGRFFVEVANRNAANSQIGASTNNAGFVIATGAAVTAAIDTTAAVDITLTGQCANSGDTITLDAYLVELIHGA